jgi:hypothetical protein
MSLEDRGVSQLLKAALEMGVDGIVSMPKIPPTETLTAL